MVVSGRDWWCSLASNGAFVYGPLLASTPPKPTQGKSNIAHRADLYFGDH